MQALSFQGAHGPILPHRRAPAPPGSAYAGRVPRLTTTLLATAGIGAAGLAYAVAEAHHTLRRVEAPVLPAGQPTLRVLHVSDMHITPRHKGREAWIRSLDALDPDLVVVTGDFLAHQEAVPTALSALEPLLEPPASSSWAPTTTTSPAR